jgi:hypothetical protein
MTEPREPCERRRRASLAGGLDRDDRGAVMVMGVFMATLLVGFVYFVQGLGDVVDYRERSQDAADVTAFAAAEQHARAMNLIALTNLTMAAAVAVYSVAPGPTSPADLAALGNQAAQAVADALPATVEDELFDYWTIWANCPPRLVDSDWSYCADSGAETAFLWPKPTRMPVADGPSAILCAKATQAAAAIGGGAVACPPVSPLALAPDARLGQEEFQVRVVVGYQYPAWLPSGPLAIASWGQDEAPPADFADLGLISRIALAQAEYHYDGAEPREEWMWRMRWRSRFRRIQMPPGDLPCPEPGAYCEAVKRLLGRGLDRAAVH